VRPFEFEASVVALLRDGSSEVIQPGPEGPVRVDGFSVGAPVMTTNAPHRGEMHPDGDELLYLISGRIDVIMEEGGDAVTVGAECVESLHPGQSILVPRGVWHRVDVREPSHLVHITPGPGGGHRPL
jgi:mannose-6-phosphate isomerase-like protein (cupin superfamily)